MTSFSYGTKWPVYAKQWDAMGASTRNGRRRSSSSAEDAISSMGIEVISATTTPARPKREPGNHRRLP